MTKSTRLGRFMGHGVFASSFGVKAKSSTVRVSAPNAADGSDPYRANAKHQSSEPRPWGVSLLATQSNERLAQSYLGHRHYLYPFAPGMAVPRSGAGLVQPLCSGLGT